MWELTFTYDFGVKFLESKKISAEFDLLARGLTFLTFGKNMFRVFCNLGESPPSHNLHRYVPCFFRTLLENFKPSKHSRTTRSWSMYLIPVAFGAMSLRTTSTFLPPKIWSNFIWVSSVVKSCLCKMTAPSTGNMCCRSTPITNPLGFPGSENNKAMSSLFFLIFEQKQSQSISKFALTADLCFSGHKWPE